MILIRNCLTGLKTRPGDEGTATDYSSGVILASQDEHANVHLRALIFYSFINRVQNSEKDNISLTS